jgi:hypothetical protein
VASKEHVLAIEHNGTNTSFDDVGVELDATVVEEASEPFPMVKGIVDNFRDQGLAGHARELLLDMS